MHVLHLIKTQTGAKWACKQIEVLIGLGIKVTVALPYENGGLADEYRRAGAQVIGANVDFPVRKLWTLSRVLDRMRNLVRKVNPDIIHSHFVGTTYIMRIALGKDHKIPRVFQVPGPLHLEKGPYGFIDKFLAGDNDYWIGSCEWTCQKYIEMGIPACKVYKALYGTNTASFVLQPKGVLRKELGIGSTIPIVGMVAYMYPPKVYLGQFVGLKGHEDFIRAISIVRKVIPNVKGIIIGGPWGAAYNYEKCLRNMACKLSGDAIVFTGFRKDVPAIYPDLDVVAHPSLSENLGGAAESLLASVPTITTNIGGFPDIVKHGETGWLVPPKNPRLLAEAIIEALTNKKEAVRRALNGQKLAVEALDVKKTARDVEKIYRSISLK
ncbi:MAG: glycosyltransferase family 1 protein [Clostridia bacterium]|nr:glycosyltransferase family 1 protein [Clostridia bacterium]